MSDAVAQAIRHAFALLCLLTGIVGTVCQVLAAWLNQIGGPREPHVAALLVGPGGTKPQDIFIADRRLISITATTLSSFGGAMLFSALVAGLVINFPTAWLFGLAIWVLVTSTSAVLILFSGYRTAMTLRISQENLFNEVPHDGWHHCIGKFEKPYFTKYRSEILTEKPDLASSVSAFSGKEQLVLLVHVIVSAFRRERIRP